MKNKAILIIIPFFRPNIGGVETRFDDICRWLANHGFTVKVITYKPITTSGVKAEKYEKEGSIEIFRVSWPGYDLFHKLQKFVFLQTVYTSLGLLVRVFFYLCRHHREIEVVHAAGFNCAFIARALCGVFKIRWVMSTHAIYGFKRKTLLSLGIRWILKGAYRVIAISEASEKELADIGVPSGKIIVHTTWVDQNIFRPLDKQECRSKLGLEDKFTVIFVGRLRKNKGVSVLLEAAGDLKDINFIFIGEGPLGEEVKSHSQRLTNIVYAGYKDKKELPFYYNASDVSVMPSLYKEPFGRVVPEALSCGRVVISSNLGGIVNYIDSSVAYLIYPSKENIKEAILDLYNNPHKFKEMSSRCRRFAEGKFSASNISTLLLGYGFSGEEKHA